MDSRERVIRALEFTSPDRVPVMHRSLPGAFVRYGTVLEDLYTRYPSDVLLSPTLRAPFDFASPVDEGSSSGTLTDEWGCVWQKTTDDYQGRVAVSPFADWAALDDYRFPDPAQGYEGVQEMVETVRADVAGTS